MHIERRRTTKIDNGLTTRRDRRIFSVARLSCFKNHASPCRAPCALGRASCVVGRGPSSHKTGFLLTVLTFLVIYCVQPSSAISCIQCNSYDDSLCGEFSPGVAPTTCNHTYEAKYCIKTTGLYGGIPGTQRFCSSRDMFTKCQDWLILGNERVFRHCLYTCSEDGCNDGNSIQIPSYQNITVFLFLLLLSIKVIPTFLL